MVLYTPNPKLSAYNSVTFLLAMAGPTEQLHVQNPDNLESFQVKFQFFFIFINLKFNFF